MGHCCDLYVPSLTLQDLVAKSVTGGVHCVCRLLTLKPLLVLSWSCWIKDTGVGHASCLGLLGLVGAKRLLKFGAEST